MRIDTSNHLADSTAIAPGQPGKRVLAPDRVEDVHELALAMPHVIVEYGTGDNPIYQVGGEHVPSSVEPRWRPVSSGRGLGLILAYGCDIGAEVARSSALRSLGRCR